MASLLKRSRSKSNLKEHSLNPFINLHQEVDRAMGDFYDMFSSRKHGLQGFENLKLLPAIDIVDDKDNFKVEVEMPGMDEKDVRLSITANMLLIHGEKSTSRKNSNKNYLTREISYGSYDRSIALPQTVDINKASASFKKGMLWVSIPKKARAKSRKSAKHISMGR